MDQLDLSALTVRRDAAMRLLEKGAITGIEALAMIVVPSPALLAASRQAAAEQKPRKVRELRPPPRTHTTKPRTFEEMMASYAA